LVTVGEYNNANAGGVGFWLLGENLGDSGKILGVRKPVRAGPSLGFGLITDNQYRAGFFGAEHRKIEQ